MNKKNKSEANRRKVFMALGMAGIIFLAAFVVMTQYQLTELNKENFDQPLFVKIFADETGGTVPLKVNFSSLVEDSVGEVEYRWDFGNGETSNEQKSSTSYLEGKDYTCSLEVTDEKGRSKTDSVVISAKKNKPPIVTLSINQQTINRGFNWLELLVLTPVAAYAGNQQLILDAVEERKGANAWGEGRLVVTAQIMDPEDDEIVSYDWKVQNADTVVTSPVLGSKDWLPVKNITGEKSVTIPELYAWTDKGHIVLLTVTDSAGNNATADIQFTVSQSMKLTKINGYKTGIKTGLPFLGMLWGLQFVKEPVTEILDVIWFDLPPILQNLILTTLGFLGWGYEPPIPKAALEVSDVADLNLTSYVNISGVVQPDASVRSDFVISNNDSSNIAENVYITLDNPISNDYGLANEIKVEDLIVDLDAGIISSKLFYEGEYTNYRDCYNIEKIAPGDLVNLGISVSLKEGSIFNKGTYQCKLYVYQGKTLKDAENVDEIPFTIII